MREIVRPLGFVVVGAGGGPGAELAVGGGREGEAGAFAERVTVAGEVMMRAVVVLGFGMETTVLEVEAHGERDAAFVGQIAAE